MNDRRQYVVQQHDGGPPHPVAVERDPQDRELFVVHGSLNGSVRAPGWRLAVREVEQLAREHGFPAIRRA